jgi:hypothetical protein
MNWPFLTFTVRRVCPQATSKSVCRARKAGTCRMSTTGAARAACCGSWMSVSTGTPTSRFTRCRMAIPSSSPGPRKLALLERLALSKLALKMYVRPSESQTRFTCSPTSRHSSADSITQGPAMTKRLDGSGRKEVMVVVV